MLQQFIDDFFRDILSKRVANKGLIFGNGHFETNHNAKPMTKKLFKTETSGKSVKYPLYPREDEQTDKDDGTRGIEEHRRLGHGGEANQDANHAQRQHIPERPLVIKRVGQSPFMSAACTMTSGA